MSIGHIEDYPTGDDSLDINDPVAEVSAPEPHAGEDAHTDDNGVAITHVQRDTGRHAWVDDLIEFGKRAVDSLDPDTAFHAKPERMHERVMSGDAAHPDRWIRDEALQVRQLVPTGFSTGRVAASDGNTTAGVLLVAERPERMTIVILCAANEIYVGSTPYGATVNNGFTVPPGSSLHLTTTAAIYVSADAADSVVTYLEQFRTDNEAN